MDVKTFVVLAYTGALCYLYSHPLHLRGRERYTIEVIVRSIGDEYCPAISSTVGLCSWFTLRKIDRSIDLIEFVQEILLAKVIFYQKICVGNQVSLAQIP